MLQVRASSRPRARTASQRAGRRHVQRELVLVPGHALARADNSLARCLMQLLPKRDAMNPAELDNLAKADKDELLGIIEAMQTRDRCAASAGQ